MYRTMRMATIAYGTTRYADSRIRQRVARSMDTAQYAVASIGVVLGLLDYRDNTLYRYHNVVIVDSVSANGKYVKVVRLTINADGIPYIDPINKGHWHNSTKFYRVADDLKEFGYIRKIAALEESHDSDVRAARNESRADLDRLSQNTVTRALVHASDRDYCQETAVALISAGHKLPDITLRLNVTVSVAITLEGARNYYALRALFGATRGDVQGASELSVEDYGNTGELIREQIESGEFTTDSIEHTDTDVHWYSPVIRLMDTYEAQELLLDQDE